MIDDYISKQKVINAMYDLCKEGSFKNNPHIDDIIKAIEDIPPDSTPWIPCSERLPKAFEYVNCTCHSLIDDREDWVIETVYIPHPLDSQYSDWGNIPMLNSGDCEVVAWMHRDIPEPYKESEVKNDT